MLNHSDQALWYATAVMIVVIAVAAGYGLAEARAINQGPVPCEVQIIDGAGIRHLWQTSCQPIS